MFKLSNSQKLLLTQLIDIFSVLKRADSREYKMPAVIGDFRFQKELSIKNVESNYRFGIYKDPAGRIAFAKAWFGNRKKADYFRLRNSVGINALSKKISTSLVKIPELYEVYEAANSIVVLMEYLDLRESSVERGKRYFNTVIEFIRKVGSENQTKLKKEIGYVGPNTIFFVSMLMSVKAVASNPGAFGEILRAITFILKNRKNLYLSNWNTLVHRDLKGNVYFSKKQLVLIDWQLATYSHKLLELAQLINDYSDDPQQFEYFIKMEVFKKDLEDQKSRAILKTLCLFLSLSEISVVQAKSKKAEKRLLQTLLKL